MGPDANARVLLSWGETLSLQVHDDLSRLTADFSVLRDGACRSVFNSPIWLANWIKTDTPKHTTAIIAARDSEGALVFVWPMAVRQRMGTLVLEWLGQDTFALNLGCWRTDLPNRLTQEDVERIFATLRNTGLSFDAVHLLNQPLQWNGARNPMALLPHQPAPNQNYERALSSDYDELYAASFSPRERRNHGRQRRRLEDFGRVEYIHPEDADEQLEILEAFFTFKARQLKEIGAPNPFQSETVRDFYRRALLSLSNDGPDGKFLALKVNNELVATLIGVQDAGRFTTLMTAIRLGPTAKGGPGQQLLEHVMETLCAQGVRVFDFGPGASTQKLRWGMEPKPLFETYMTFAPRAVPITWLTSRKSRLVHKIKNNTRLYRLVSDARARIAGR